MKVVNIDEFLQEKAFEIVLNGKSFTVKDIDPEAFELLKNDGATKEVIKKLLGCKDEDLKGYGIATYGKIIKEITENLLQEPSQNDQLED
jgi:hypothetical protein